MAVSTTPTAPRTKPRRTTRRPLLFVGIGMAVVAFLLVLALGTRLSPSAAAPVQEATVVVAASSLASGTVLTAGDLTTVRMPVSAAPPAATAHTAPLVGQMTGVAIVKGQPVTTNLVAAPGYVKVPSGWVAETIPADELEAATVTYAKKGDAIDVIATIDTGSGTTGAASQPETKSVFTNVRVLAVGAHGGTQQGTSSNLTVLLTPCDAVYLSWLINDSASFNYTLLSGTDYGAAPSGPSPSCPLGSNPAPVGQSQVFARFGFQG